MTEPKYQERRLLVVSKRREATDEGLARVVAALVLHRLSQRPSAGSSEDKDSA